MKQSGHPDFLSKDVDVHRLGVLALEQPPREMEMDAFSNQINLRTACLRCAKSKAKRSQASVGCNPQREKL